MRMIKPEMMGCQWYQLDHMQVICMSLQTDNHARTSSLNVLCWLDVLLYAQPSASKHEGKMSCLEVALLWECSRQK